MTIMWLEVLTIFFFTLGNYLNYIDRSLTFTILPIIGEEYNITKTDEGTLASSFLVGYVVFSIICCILAHKMKVMYIVAIGCVIWCVSCFLMYCGNLPMFYVARILSGVGEAAYQSLIPAFIETNFDPKRVPLYLGIFFSGIYVGSSIGIAIGGLLDKIWRYAFLIEMFVMFINVGFLFYYSTKEKFEKKILDWTTLKRILKSIFTNKFWWSVTIAYAFFNFTVGAVNTWLPSLIVDKFPNGTFEELETELGVVIMVSSLLSAIFSSILVKTLNTKFPNYFFTINSGMIAILFIIALVPIFISLNISMVWPLFLFCVFIFILLLTATTLPINYLLLKLISQEAKNYSMAISICLIHLLGDIPSPIIVGKIWDATKNATVSIEYASIGLIISVLIFLAIFIVSFTHEKQQLKITNNTIIDNDIDTNDTAINDNIHNYIAYNQDDGEIEEIREIV